MEMTTYHLSIGLRVSKLGLMDTESINKDTFRFFF